MDCIYVPDVYERAPKQFAHTCLMFILGCQNSLHIRGLYYLSAPKQFA